MRLGAVVLALTACPSPRWTAPPHPAPAPSRITDRDARSTQELRLRVDARAPESGDVVQLLAGGSIVCARRHEADVACLGRVGLFDPSLSEHAGAPAAEPDPVTLSGFRGVVEMSGGVDGRCLLEAEGGAWCWGDRFAWDAAFEPLAPQRWPATGRFTSVAADRGAYAVIDGAVGRRGEPVCEAEATDGLRDASRIAVGDNGGCVLHRDGGLSCWPRDCTGPATPIEGVTRVVQIVAGSHDVCGRTAAGRAWCFRHPSPEWLPLERVVHLAAGGGRACALRDDGAVHCWTLDLPPERVDGLGPSIDLAVLEDRACALDVDRELVCLGATPGPRIPAAQWRNARELWPGFTRDDVVRDGAVQGFRAAAGDALGELQYNLDRYCERHDCGRRWPPPMGPTVADGDDALRGWPDLSPTNDPIEIFAGARVTAAPVGGDYVFTVSYRGSIFDHDVTLSSACHRRPRPDPDRASFRRITCDAPILGP